MLEIQEKDVKNALLNGEEELEIIHKRVLALYDELLNTASKIRSISLRSPCFGSIGSTGGEKKDLLEIMIKHESLIRQHEIEIREEIRKLTEDEETINRIRVCYQALRGKEYTYLNLLYVQNKPYKEVEKESGVSHRTFEKIRKLGIKKIIKMYASNRSNREIINSREELCGKENHDERDYHQLKLNKKMAKL